MIKAVLFDWGNTLMRDDAREAGPMCNWITVRSCPHAPSTLRILALDYIIALATNASESHTREIRGALRRVRINCYVSKVYCSTDMGVRKPSKEFFHQIARDLALPPEEIAMVGDSLQNDIRGALEAGLRALWYVRPREPRPPCPGAVLFTDFRQLPRLIRELF